MLFKKNKKEENYFFNSFVELCEYPREELKIVEEGLRNFDPSKSLELKDTVHKIEHEADLKKKEIEERLAKEFITPIDREDIFLIMDEIDDLSDAIDEISYKLYIRNYQSLPPNLEPFLVGASKAVESLYDVIKNMPNISNKEIMDPKIKKVLAIEEEVDKIYEEYVHSLYVNDTDYIKNRMYERIYGYFEYVTDKCRDVCKTILITMYKNI